MRRFFDAEDPKIALYALLWALGIYFIGVWAHALFPLGEFYTWAHKFKGTARLFTPFARWDSLHYFRIANFGYESVSPGLPAFFPGFPLAALGGSKIFVLFMKDSELALLAAGLALNFFFLIASLWAVRRLHEKEWDAPGALKTCALMLVFPYAFFYLAFYAEAMFLCLTAFSFLAALNKKWWLAAFFAAGASATRLQGVFLAPALLAEYLDSRRWQWRQIRPDILWLLLCPAGLFLFLAHLGGPAAYLQAAGAWTQRVFNPNILVPYLQFFRDFFLNGKAEFSDLISVIFSLLCVFLFVIGWRRLRAGYRVYIGISLAVPLLTSVVQAVGRYDMVLFPLFIIASLETEKRPAVLWALVVFSTLVQSLLIARFTTGFWVA